MGNIPEWFAEKLRELGVMYSVGDNPITWSKVHKFKKGNKYLIYEVDADKVLAADVYSNDFYVDLCRHVVETFEEYDVNKIEENLKGDITNEVK